MLALARAGGRARARATEGARLPGARARRRRPGLARATCRGKVVLSRLLGVVVRPVRAALPAARGAAARNFRASDFPSSRVNVDREPATRKAFLAAAAGRLPERAATRRARLPERFGVETMPTSFLIDRDGVVRHVHRGFRKRATSTPLREQIQSSWRRTQKPPQAPWEACDASSRCIAVLLRSAAGLLASDCPRCGRGSATRSRAATWPGTPTRSRPRSSRTSTSARKRSLAGARRAAAAAAAATSAGAEGAMTRRATSAPARGAHAERAAWRALRAAARSRRCTASALALPGLARRRRPRRSQVGTLPTTALAATPRTSVHASQSRRRAARNRYDIDIHQLQLGGADQRAHLARPRRRARDDDRARRPGYLSTGHRTATRCS